MSKTFRPSTRESRIISEIQSSREFARRKAITRLKECILPLSNALAMKLLEDNLIETTSKTTVEIQFANCLEKLTRAEDFDIDYQVAPFRHVSSKPDIISLYVTAFILESLIKHKDVIDIYGSDDEIYGCVHKQVKKFID